MPKKKSLSRKVVGLTDCHPANSLHAVFSKISFVITRIIYGWMESLTHSLKTKPLADTFSDVWAFGLWKNCGFAPEYLGQRVTTLSQPLSILKWQLVVVREMTPNFFLHLHWIYDLIQWLSEVQLWTRLFQQSSWGGSLQVNTLKVSGQTEFLNYLKMYISNWCLWVPT